MKDFVLDIRELLSKTEDSIAFQLKGDVDLPEDCQIQGSIALSGKCQSMGNHLVLVSGELCYMASGICARCLAPASSWVETDFSERFSRAPDDDEIFRYTGDSLDLSEAVRQAVLLVYPEKLLCREDCKGICPICGQVLNERDCGCTAKGSDLEED